MGECKYYGVPFSPWLLLEFDFGLHAFHRSLASHLIVYLFSRTLLKTEAKSMLN
jgi:hypothetical protein